LSHADPAIMPEPTDASVRCPASTEQVDPIVLRFTANDVVTMAADSGSGVPRLEIPCRLGRVVPITGVYGTRFISSGERGWPNDSDH
jgi:hypothetical protein